MEENGRFSSTKRTKHINIRYYFIKQVVDSKQVTIEYCPTEDMVSDYFTKPLQGRLFYKLRDIIMNVDPSSEYYSGHRSVLSLEDDDIDDDMTSEVNDNSEHGVDKDVVENSDTRLVADMRGLENTDATMEDSLGESAGSRNQSRTCRNVRTYAAVARSGLNNG